MRQIISNKNSFSPSRYLALFMLWKASKQQMESMLRWVGSQRKKSIPLKIFGRHNAWPEFQNWFSFRTFSSSSISSAACTLPFRRGSWVQGGESIELIVSLNHINSRTHTHTCVRTPSITCIWRIDSYSYRFCIDFNTQWKWSMCCRQIIAHIRAVMLLNRWRRAKKNRIIQIYL